MRVRRSGDIFYTDSVHLVVKIMLLWKGLRVLFKEKHLQVIKNFRFAQINFICTWINQHFQENWTTMW
jgi:hypothetical protein